MKHAFFFFCTMGLFGGSMTAVEEPRLPADSADLLGKMGEFSRTRRSQADAEIRDAAKSAIQILLKHQQRESGAGNLEQTLAVKAEIEKLAKTGEQPDAPISTDRTPGNGPGTDSKLPSDSVQVLEKLRTFSLERHAEADAEIRTKAEAVLKVLEQHQIRETKAGRLESAVAIGAAATNLEKSWAKNDSASGSEEFAVSPISDRKMRIPQDASVFKKHSYLVITVASPAWTDCKKECEKLGGHLAIVNSAEEQAFLAQLAPDSHLYLGAHVEATAEKPSTQWRWVDGTPVATEYATGMKPSLPRTMPTVLVLWNGSWAGHKNESAFATGFICEWPGERD